MIAKTMRELKTIATRWNVVVCLMAHVNQTEMDKQPTLRELRGSASIAQEADTVIVLWRQMVKKKNQVIINNNVNVSIQANRRTGKTGNVQMVYDDGHFFERVWVEDTEQTKKADEEFSKW
jgi:replicative DNA helicase